MASKSSLKPKKSSQKPAQAPAQTPPTPKLRRVRRWYAPWLWHEVRPTPNYAPLPKVRVMASEAVRPVWRFRQPFAGIVAVYAISTLLFVGGVAGTQDLVALRSLLDEALTGASGTLQSLFVQVSFLFGSSTGTKGPAAAVYQSMLLVICGLALLWALRQAHAKKAFTTKMAYYQGMNPLIPLVIVIGWILVQTFPFSIALFLYDKLLAGGILVGLVQQIPMLVVCLLLAFWSLYMLTASLFALFIVTLPGMTPLRALRSAKELVYKRRLVIWRKLIAVPIAFVCAVGLVTLPFVIVAVVLAPSVFFIASIIAVALCIAYVYELYRKLLV